MGQRLRGEWPLTGAGRPPAMRDDGSIGSPDGGDGADHGDAARADRAERQRAALRRFMEQHHLRPHPWARQAGVASGSLYAFLKGESDSLSLPVLTKLAEVAGTSVATLLGDDEAPPADAPIGFAMRGDAIVALPRPLRQRAPMPRDARPEAMRVAIVQGAGTGTLLRPGALLYWHEPALSPEAALGRLCVVEIAQPGSSGGSGRVLADVRRGFGGRFLLVSPAGHVTEDADVVAAAPLEWLHLPS